MKNRFRMLAIGVSAAIGFLASDAQALECCYRFTKQGSHLTVSGEIYGLYYCDLVNYAERQQLLTALGVVASATGSVLFTAEPRGFGGVFTNNSCAPSPRTPGASKAPGDNSPVLTTNAGTR